MKALILDFVQVKAPSLLIAILESLEPLEEELRVEHENCDWVKLIGEPGLLNFERLEETIGFVQLEHKSIRDSPLPSDRQFVLALGLESSKMILRLHRQAMAILSKILIEHINFLRASSFVVECQD